MKKKFLFWIDIFMAHFGLAYQLQQKLDADFFAIIDTPNNPKKMFETQKLVNFNKKWFFHDQIKKSFENPDLKYLSEFEKKYGIDLWKLAINERHFYKYNRFYKFSKNEILKFLEQECKFYEKILDEIKPDYIVLNEPPFHPQKLIMELCRSKGIKILCLCISRYEASTIIAENNATFDLPQNLDLIELKDLAKSELENNMSYNQTNLKWADERKFSFLGKLKALIDYILISDSKNSKNNYTYYGRKKYKVLLDTVLFYIRKQQRYKYLNNNSEKKINLEIPFVYFPLGVDDDIVFLHDTPFFTDQVEVIKHVAKSIPIDYKIYVKEHFYAGFRAWKEINHYKEIKKIPNVVFVHPSYPSQDLIKNSNLVITVRGSSSMEAAYENKPSINFGSMPQDILPSVYKVESLKDLPKLIKTALNSPIDPIYIKKYDKLIRDRVVDFNWSDMEIIRNAKFYSGNILSDVEYPESKVKEFFEENKDMFEKLANAHLKKINSEYAN